MISGDTRPQKLRSQLWKSGTVKENQMDGSETPPLLDVDQMVISQKNTSLDNHFGK